MAAESRADIFVVGLGISPTLHISRETEEVFRSCEEILYLDTNVASMELLRQYGSRVTALFGDSYRQQSPRLNAYRWMAARVVDAALEHSPVAFAIQGHPLYGVYAPRLICDMADAMQLAVRILPAMSSLDCLCADLRFDPFQTGMQLFEATDILLRRRPLASDVPLVVCQVGNLETRLHTTRPSKPQRLHRFQQYLLQFYPAGHPLIGYFASPHPLMPYSRLEFRLSELAGHAPQLHAGFSLFVPPAVERPIQDRWLLARLDDPQHLKSLTESE